MNHNAVDIITKKHILEVQYKCPEDGSINIIKRKNPCIYIDQSVYNLAKLADFGGNRYAIVNCKSCNRMHRIYID